MEPLAEFETRDGSGGQVAGADSGHGFQVLAHEIHVECRPQGLEPRFIDVHASAEEPVFGAKKDDTRVYELLAVDAGNDAQRGVIKRCGRGHAKPPEQS